MGKKDIAVKKYLSDYERFADAFNYFMFGGEKVILPESLTRKDPTEMSLFKINGSFDSKEKMRDLKERCVVMDSGEAVLITLAIEGQEHVHYAMPPKNMMYDALDYDSQVRKTAKEHKKKGDIIGDEYISGFSKEDKLVPVITLIIYFGSKEWDAPLSLSEMFDVRNEKILKYVNDYRVNIIQPRNIDDLSKFATDLGLILEFFKNAESKTQMRQYLDNNREVLSSLEEDAVELLTVCGNVNIEDAETDEGGNVNMCKAIDDMIQDAVDEKEKEMCKAIDDMIQDAVDEKEKEMCKAIDDMIQDAVDEKEKEMCKAIDDMIQDAVDEKEKEMCKAIDDMIQDAVDEKEKEMCKAIDDMIQDAVDEKEKEMCKAIDDMIQDAVEQGIEQGIKILILDNLEEGRTRETIIPKIIKNFSLSEKEANGYFTRYSGGVA